MVSKKVIEAKFNQLAKLTNLEKKENCETYLNYDFNANYGGYSMFLVLTNTGAQRNPFNGYVNACQRYFYNLICGLITGIEYKC